MLDCESLLAYGKKRAGISSGQELKTTVLYESARPPFLPFLYPCAEWCIKSAPFSLVLN